MTQTQLLVKLIKRDGTTHGEINVPNFNRKASEPYEPRAVTSMGHKFMEPTADILDVCPVTDWHEVAA